MHAEPERAAPLDHCLQSSHCPWKPGISLNVNLGQEKSFFCIQRGTQGREGQTGAQASPAGELPRQKGCCRSALSSGCEEAV